MNWDHSKFDWNHSRAFLVTAEEGTLSAAALALGLTQPTLSRQVAALEAELSVTLFERVGQRLILTHSGLELLEYAKMMGDAALQFSLRASGQSEQMQGKVVVSTGELDAIYRMPKIIAKLRHQEPGIEIEVVVTNEISDLKRREADIAIRSFQPTQGDLIARKLGEEEIWLYGTRAYLSGLDQNVDVSSLSNCQIIGFDQSHHRVSDVLNQSGWQVSKENFQIVTSFQPLQLALCKQELGLVFFPKDLAPQEPKLICAFKQFGPVFRLPIWLVSHQELRTNLRVRRVYDVLAEELKMDLAENRDSSE